MMMTLQRGSFIFLYRLSILLIIAGILFLCSSYANASALDWPLSMEDHPVTSEFGWRVHPIYGTSKFHSGVDIGADYGEPVMAAADGYVEEACWISGYGNTVILRHTDAVETLYGHNQGFAVSQGQHVVKGQVIAYAGSTGNSTGPHVHFEVRVNDEPVSPYDYCGGSPLPGNPAMGGGGFSAEKKFKWDKEHDFSKPLYEIVDTFSTLIVDGFKRIKDVMKKFLVILLVIDLAIAATLYSVNPKFNEGEQGLVGFLLHKLLLYGILIWLVTNWSSVLVTFCRDFALYTSSTALGVESKVVANMVHDPFDILTKGLNLISPLLEHAILLDSGPISIFLLLACLLLALVFFMISWYLASSYLEFYASVLFGFCTFFFAGSKHLRHHSENGLNGIFYASIKLLTASFLAFIILGLVKELAVDDYVQQKTTPGSVILPVTDGNFGGIEDLDRVSNIIAWHESKFDYEVYNGGGRTPSSGDGGYGAWQFTDDFFESVATDFDAEHPGVLHPANSVCEPENSPNHYAGTGITYETGATGTLQGSRFSYCPENQRLIATYELQRRWEGKTWAAGAYNTYHNWINVIKSWNGGDPNYYNIVMQDAAGAHMVSPPLVSIVIDFVVLLKLVVVSMLLLFIVSRLNKSVQSLCGGNGFRFATRDFE